LLQQPDSHFLLIKVIYNLIEFEIICYRFVAFTCRLVSLTAMAFYFFLDKKEKQKINKEGMLPRSSHTPGSPLLSGRPAFLGSGVGQKSKVKSQKSKVKSQKC